MMVWLYYFIIFSLAWETCNQPATQREKKMFQFIRKYLLLEAVNDRNVIMKTISATSRQAMLARHCAERTGLRLLRCGLKGLEDVNL